MKLSHFNFELPNDLLAEYPADHRDESKLMVIHRESGKIEHKLFKDLIDYFDEGDVMVLNNTKVFPARLFENTTSRGRTLRFLYDGAYPDFRRKLRELGQTPLPKYIKRDVEPEDEDRYQTIYAKHEGAVAAPTAGLHFSKHLLKRLEIKGIDFAELTLHVGLGTFNPVEVEDLSKHKMDSEELIIDERATEIVNNAKQEKRKVCAVGTTAMRGLESAVSSEHTLNTFEGWTNKFIFPPYEFSIANAMITNFHLPKSTLLMMVSAFLGHDLMKRAYKEAILEQYRFYSYGDAMLIL
ncbi:MAG: tRNA preQ1(34) S-adenosylmethionine ribosyltransferase-isomerase QueA [Robiginitalea sp.]